MTTEYCFNDEDTEALTGAWNDLMMMTVIVTVKIYHLFIMCHTQLSSYMLSYFFLTRTPSKNAREQDKGEKNQNTQTSGKR